MPWGLANRVAVVTGVSGTIGRVVTKRLMNSGVTVFGTTRLTSFEEIDKLKASFDFQEMMKSEATLSTSPIVAAPLGGIFSCDMESEKSIDDCVKKIIISLSSTRTDAKQIDLFVNCAGITQNKLLARTTQEDLMKMYLTNSVAPVLMAKSILRFGGMMTNPNRSKDGGCMIALGSVVGEDGNAGQVAYAASKGALTSSWKSLAKEFGGKGIRFNVVSPGLVESTMAETISEEKKKAWAEQNALGRLVKAEEVADAILNCCECTGMTGQVIRVDCGTK